MRRIQVEGLIHRKERVYFALLLIYSIFVYIALLFSIIGIVIAIILVIIPLFFFFLSMAMIRTNGIKVTKNQFPEIYGTVEEVAAKMGMEKLPDVYIIQSMGIINAFATRFFGRNMIVLYSEIADLLIDDGKKELDFVIAHELAHIKRNHILKSLLVIPGNWIPFLAEAYSRTCEYTCDAMASHYTADLKASKNALLVLAAGKHLYRIVNEEEYLREASNEKGFFAWLSEKLSTHPNLPKRIYALESKFGQGYNMDFRTPTKLKVIIISVFAGTYLLFLICMFLLGMILNSDLYSDFVLSSEETTPLMLAITNDDTEEVRKLIEDGEDINKKDADGWTALHYAVLWYDEEELEESFIDPEIVKMLLDHGADPNIKTEAGEIVLPSIASEGDSELLDKMIEQGADVNLQDEYGETALFNAVYNEDAEMVEKLLENGADPHIKNSENLTVIDIAEENGYTDITELLKNAHI